MRYLLIFSHLAQPQKTDSALPSMQETLAMWNYPEGDQGLYGST